MKGGRKGFDNRTGGSEEVKGLFFCFSTFEGLR